MARDTTVYLAQIRQDRLLDLDGTAFDQLFGFGGRFRGGLHLPVIALVRHPGAEKILGDRRQQKGKEEDVPPQEEFSIHSLYVEANGGNRQHVFDVKTK